MLDLCDSSALMILINCCAALGADFGFETGAVSYSLFRRERKEAKNQPVLWVKKIAHIEKSPVQLTGA